MTDEIMMEVHAIKDTIGTKYGDNLDALFEEIQLGEAKLKAAGVQVLSPFSERVLKVKNGDRFIKTSGQPVFHFDSFNPAKLPDIVRNQNSTECPGLGGDQQIVRSDQLADSFQACPDLPIVTRCF